MLRTCCGIGVPQTGLTKKRHEDVMLLDSEVHQRHGLPVRLETIVYLTKF
jgi:hypothetical protein